MVKKSNTKVFWRRLVAVVSIVAMTVASSTLFIRTVFAADTIDIVSSSTADVPSTGEKLYFDSATHGAHVTMSYATRQLSGYAWSADMGWVNFGGGAENPEGPVMSDALGNLSGKAKVELGGYIDFNTNPEGANVKVESVTGQFSGFAWSEDLGWIDFANVSAPGFYLESEAPNNPGAVTAQAGAANLTTGSYYNYADLTFSWTAPADNAAIGAPAGVVGYHVYWGTNAAADPTADGAYQTGTMANQSLVPANDGQRFYLRIVTEDALGNRATPVTLFDYRYDITKPANPGTATASPSGFSTTDIFDMSWPAASDPGRGSSGVTAYQYKRAGGGDDWSVTIPGTSLTGVHAYQTGQNDWYIRSIDGAGNIADGYSTVSYYYSGIAPSAPTDLTASLSSTVTNSYTFSWTEPVSSNGVKGYHYVVNAVPTVANTTFVAVASLGPLAINPAQNGCNTFYVVAEDNSSQINWANYATVTFGCGDSFDINTLPTGANAATDDTVKKAVINVTSEVCYAIDEPSVTTLGTSNVTAPTAGIKLLGGIQFSLNCTMAGGSANVALALGTQFGDISKLRAYKNTGASLTDITSQVTFINKVVGGATKTILTYSLVDGGSLDEDGVVNGAIIDPIYIGEVAGAGTTAPTPTTPTTTTTPAQTDDTLADTGNSIFAASLAAFTLLATAVILWHKNRKIYRHVSFR